jgi:peptidoglycan/LPS O-acetylase OafA/YrhL
MVETAGRSPRLRHIPGLDGVRAIAVLAVIAFHGGLGWLPGGYYGVDAFFALSGFLITSLLVKEWQTSGTIGLRRFWARRARRLLPALYVMVAAVGVSVILFPTVLGTPNLFQSAMSTLFYGANWYFVASHANYFSAGFHPSPFLHTWSLAIEEQFYLLWPLIVLVVLRGSRRRAVDKTERRFQVAGDPESSLVIASRDRRRAGRRRIETLFVVSSVGAAASAIAMAVLTPAGASTARAYYGTDTRAQSLLVGAALAALLALFGPVKTVVARRVIGSIAVAGVVGTVLIWRFVPETSSLAFHGGFLLAALSTAAIIGGAVQVPKGIVARFLSLWPLRALGRISYGVYLWYWPSLLVLTASRVGFGGTPLFLVRLFTTVAIAAVSYKIVELPILRGSIPGWRALVAAPAAAAVTLGVLLVATLAPVGATGAQSSTTQSASSALLASSTGASLGSSGGLGARPSSRSHLGSPRPVKVLLVGDSMAGSLGVGLGQVASRYGVQLVNEGSPGCSVSMDQMIKVLFYTISPGAPCKAGDPGALLSRWRSWVDAYNPDVVVYLARGELFNQEYDGRWSNLGNPRFDAYVTKRFEEAVNIFQSRGASVVMLTIPYSNSGEQPSGAPWPEDLPARVSVDNSIIEKVADLADKRRRGSAASSRVRVFHLRSLVTPGRHYAKVVSGVDLRCSDGVHFTAVGGRWVATRLLPFLVSSGRAHAADSPGGTWPGPLPPSTPSWWKKLPCATS